MDNEKWKNRINTLYKCNYERAKPFETEYETCELKLIKKANCTDDTIVLICVVKDDLARIRKFIDHYHMLGITHFAFVDNKSSDGTYEFLLEQEDCDVYECSQTYSSLRRVVWINKLISMYGSNSWYIMVDSDEFIFYQEMERYSLVDLIRFAERKKISRISGYLLDMYSKKNLFEIDQEDDFVKECRYFDGTGYDIHNTDYGVSITGGPRRRVFRTNNELAKCPIFKLAEEDIVASAHFLLPRVKAKDNPIWLAIGHYKFLDTNDIKKINDAVRNENYASGSYDYKSYQSGIQNRNVKSFYNEDISLEFIDGIELGKLPFINFPVGGLDGQE